MIGQPAGPLDYRHVDVFSDVPFAGKVEDVATGSAAGSAAASGSARTGRRHRGDRHHSGQVSRKAKQDGREALQPRGSLGGRTGRARRPRSRGWALPRLTGPDLGLLFKRYRRQ
jgi:hypothetical protein